MSQDYRTNEAVVMVGRLATEQPLKQLRERENSLLLSSGFNPVEGNLWTREGSLFGREAALQRARRFADD